MLKAQVYWIDGPWPGRLGILPRPRGDDWLEDEVRSWKAAGLSVVAALLTPEEAIEFDLTSEAEVCRRHGIEFICFPIPDRSVPSSRTETLDFLKRFRERVNAGQKLAVHCRQGIGRSGLIAGCLLVLAGMGPAEAIRRVSQARGVSVPETSEQHHWLIGFAATLEPHVRDTRNLGV